MNQFDDRLGQMLKADDIDRSSRPDLGAVRSSWRRRRHQRRAGAAAVMSLAVLGAGAGIVALSQNSPDERVVTVTETGIVTTVDSTPTTMEAVLPTTVETTDDVVEPETTIAPDLPTSTSAPVVTEAPASPVNSVPATDTRGLDVANGFVDGTIVLQVENRTEIRAASGSLLWSYEHCAEGATCDATVQTVLDDGVWLIVNEGLVVNGPPASSRLLRVPFDGQDAEVVAEAAPGGVLMAGQPTVDGLLLATVSDASQRWRAAVTVRSDDDSVTTIIDGVDAVEVSADGRFVATTFANPPEDYGRTFLDVFDLETGRTNGAELGLVTAAPVEWSADRAHLIVRDTWEDQDDFVIDPWSDAEISASELGVGAERACFVDSEVVAEGGWTVPYAEDSATTGSVQLRNVESGEMTADLDIDVFAVSMVCHPDGTVTIAQLPLIETTFGSADDPFVVTEPDRDAPVEIRWFSNDGTPTPIDRGEVQLASIR